MSTLADINSKITFLTGASTTNYTNADRVLSINDYKNRILTAILRSEDEWDFDEYSITTSYPIGKRNLIANQQDYKFSTTSWGLVAPEGASDVADAAIRPLRIKRVEVTYNGTNWYVAQPIDQSEMSVPSNQTDINNVFQTTKPYYDLQWNGIFLYPVPTGNVTDGLKVTFDRGATDYTSSDLSTGTAVPGFDTNFHMILAYGASYEYGLAKGKDNTQALKKELDQMMIEMTNYYGKKSTDRNWMLKPNPIVYE